jgi:hypothetical protein
MVLAKANWIRKKRPCERCTAASDKEFEVELLECQHAPESGKRRIKMSNVSPSKLGEEFNAEFQKKVDACTTPEQLKELFHNQELAQGMRVPDPFDETLLHLANIPQPRGYAKTVTVNGVKHILEGATETELADAEVSLYRSLFSQPAAETEQPRDPATGQFRATADQERAAATAADPATEAARQADLRGQMIRGEISPEEFAIQSGAIERALASAGIDPEALREVSHQQYEQNWASATEEFLASSDWPGGEINRQRLGETLIAMDAIDSPSVDTLRRAYQILKDKNKLVENAELTRERRLAEAKSPAEIREILNYRGDQGSGIWGGR